jgi:hypothetical protein
MAGAIPEASIVTIFSFGKCHKFPNYGITEFYLKDRKTWVHSFGKHYVTLIMLNCLYFIPRIEQEIFLHSICRENFFEKIFGIFHFYSYLCSAVPVRPSPRLFDAGDDPGFFVFAKVHKYFDSDNKKAFFLCFSFYFPHPQSFFNNSLHLSEGKRIFAEEKLHSAS